MKGIWIWKGGIKLSMFADHVIIYVENPKQKKNPPGTNKQ